MDPVNLFPVGPASPPNLTIDPGEEVALEVRGAFPDIDDIKSVLPPFTLASEGHPLAPIAGPALVRCAGRSLTMVTGSALRLRLS